MRNASVLSQMKNWTHSILWRRVSRAISEESRLKRGSVSSEGERHGNRVENGTTKLHVGLQLRMRMRMSMYIVALCVGIASRGLLEVRDNGKRWGKENLQASCKVRRECEL